jgi:hypothetical protein
MDSFSLLVVDRRGRLKRLRAPFLAQVRIRFKNLTIGQAVIVTRVRATSGDSLLYEINGLFLPHSFLTLS